MKKIKWIGPPGEKELYFNHGQGWQHYTKLAVPIDDYKLPTGPFGSPSKGYRAVQVLLRLGYNYELSD